MNAFLAFENKIPAARKALESEFRSMLGDPPDRRPPDPVDVISPASTN